LLIVTGGIAWEAILRFWAPAPAHAMTIILVAAAGIVINGGTALLFMSGSKRDLNLRAAFQHMMADALVALGVVAAGIIIMLTAWRWLDPAVSLAVSAIIVAGTWSLLREALNLSLDAVPEGIERGSVNDYLSELPGVLEVHDLHIWGLSTTETALTAHLICSPGVESESLLPKICAEVRSRFSIGHVTIQLETEAVARQCELRPDHVV
jgi:cobalt-zinc-cadmium efflux system protein